ncbi:MAG TPA: ChbG/HpnK family deacetylase [Thermoanaerobaculia bacterium]|nr:ChbG/HpnK family deacetylase [Thermoanaerobaculia bacterium]
MRRLIVTADDVGLHRGMTAGAIRAHREGIVTACSVVANGVAFEDAVARLRDVPSLEVGVHLALVEERSLTGLRMPRKYTTFAPLYVLRAIPIAAIEQELRAQLERVLASGLRVTHLNGHQHLHLLPRIFRVVASLAKEYGIPYVRIVDERSFGARAVSMRVLSALGRRARAPFTNEHTIGVGIAGHLHDVVPLLDGVEGVTELVTHPGIDVDGYAWGYDWNRETDALCAPHLRAELTKRGIALIAPSMHLHRAAEL